jgi:hypothetical protein
MISEIKQRDSLIAEMKPKAQAWDKLSQVLDMMPGRSLGYGEDFLWTLEEELKRVQEASTKPSSEAEA